MTVGDLIKNKDYDYISVRLHLPNPEIFDVEDIYIGCCKSVGGKLISLDGDYYSEDWEVVRYEEWSGNNTDAEPDGYPCVENGLTIVV